MAVLNPQSLFMILWHFLYSLLPYHKISHFLFRPVLPLSQQDKALKCYTVYNLENVSSKLYSILFFLAKVLISPSLPLLLSYIII